MSSMKCSCTPSSISRSKQRRTSCGDSDGQSHRRSFAPTIGGRNLRATESIDYLRLAVPGEITTTLSRTPDLAVRPFTATAGYEQGSDLGVVGADLNQKLRIKFERAGVKTVMVRYANLELD